MRCYDSAFLRGRRRGRWCRSGCVEQNNKEVGGSDGARRAGTTERGWRKGGKRRKQKAIAYERQLAPLMACETKQKSEASSSNTIKPTVRASRSRGRKRGREGRMRWRRNKEPAGNNGARATATRAAVAVCRCPTLLSLLYPLPVFPSLSLFPCAFLISFFFLSFFLFSSSPFSCFSPLTTPRGNCFRVTREDSLWKIKDR